MIPMPAIYVHDTKQTPYAWWIVHGNKVIETRTRNVLKRFTGKRVLVIRTQSGHKAEVIGEVTIVNAKFYCNEELESMRQLTMIPKGDRYDCTGKGKWCYWLANATEYEKPIPLSDYEIITRNMSYAIVKKVA